MSRKLSEHEVGKLKELYYWLLGYMSALDEETETTGLNGHISNLERGIERLEWDIGNGKE